MAAFPHGKFLLLAVLLHAALGHAQTTSLNSSGSGTKITPQADGVTYDITGGTRPGNGLNLFHSFGNFSVGTGDVANFRNDTGLATANILGRVTAGETSNVFGTIRTTDFGSANLFLINPAGWVFGPGATLDVGGSFHVSTADYIRFADGAQFFADSARTSVLTSAPPTAFGFLGPTAPILIDTAFLQVPEGQTLSVVGGDVQISNSTLYAPSGRVQIGSFASAGEASIDGLNGSFSTLGHVEISSSTVSAADMDGDPSIVNGGTVLIRGGEIDITNFSLIDTSGTQTFDADSNLVSTAGGSVIIRGGQLWVDSSTIGSLSFGDTNGGAINLSATESITISNGSTVITQASADFGSGLGRGGDIQMSAPLVNVDTSLVTTQSMGAGPAGGISVQAGTLSVVNGGGINSAAAATGDAGSVSIQVDTLNVAGGAGIGSVTSGTGRGGDVNINATESVTVSGTDAGGSPSSLFTFTSQGGGGDAGQLTVSTPALRLSDSGTISTFSDRGRAGDVFVSVDTLSVEGGATINSLNLGSVVLGGNVSIAASAAVTVSGATANGTQSRIVADTCQTCTASGNISIRAGTVSVTDGAFIQSGDATHAGGGSVTLAATDSIAISEKGGVSTSADTLPVGPINLSAPHLLVDNGYVSATTLGEGHGGDIAVQAQTVTLSRGGQIASNSELDARGLGGDISVATNTLLISGTSPDGVARTPLNTNASSGIFSQTQGVGNAGAIGVTAQTVTMSDTGTISVATSGSGTAGRVALSAGSLTLSGGAKLNSSTTGGGPGGAIALDASDVHISGGRSGLFSTTSGTQNAGQIVVTSPFLLMADAGTISVATSAAGTAGDVSMNIGTLNLGTGATINSSTTGGGAGGAIKLNSSTLGITGTGSGLFSTAASTGDAGTITVASTNLNLGSGGKISASTVGGGRAGTIVANVGMLNLASGGAIESSTSGAGAGGSISLNVGALAMAGAGAGLSSTAAGTGNAGEITISGSSANVADGARISVTTSGAGNAGTITANVGTMTVSGGQLDSSTSAQGNGGAINVNAGSEVSVLNGGRITGDSIGSGSTGNITVAAGNRITMTGGSISTRALTSDGGNIVLRAPQVVRIENSQITTSVQSGTGAGGNIMIDPVFLLTNNSTITANAFGGPGGNITIIADNFLPSASTLIEASSALSTPGTIQIVSPENNLASSIAQLPRAFVDASRLLRGSCSARREGAPSSFMLAGRGGVPPDADGYLPSFIGSGSAAPLALARLDYGVCAY